MITDKSTCSVLIDWLQYTVAEASFPDNYDKQSVEQERGIDFYTHVQVFSDGRMVLRNPTRPDMKHHIILNGGTLANLDLQYGTSPFEIVRNLSQDAKVSRIDVALDIMDGSLSFDELADDLQSGRAETRAKEINRFEGLKNNGDTIYVGSPRARKRLRIYDKAAEAHLDGMEWTRIELQSRQKYAQAVVRKITADDFDVSVIPGLIMGFCDFPSNGQWTSVFHGMPVVLSVPRPESDKTLDWLIRQVAPALARLQYEKPHLNAFSVFMRAYNENLNMLG